jgi:hypothetical protein
MELVFDGEIRVNDVRVWRSDVRMATSVKSAGVEVAWRFIIPGEAKESVARKRATKGRVRVNIVLK